MSTTDRAFFEGVYRANSDPWDLAGDPYERHRYATIVGHVPVGRFRRAFEPGCSVGELTALLAARCEHVDAIDISATAVALAIARCREFSNVSIERGALPDDLPRTDYDLIAFVEVGYYLDADVLEHVARRLDDRLAPGGRMIAAHWIGRSDDHVQTGEAVHDILRRCSTAQHQRTETYVDARRDGFVLDVWDRPSE